MQCPHCGLTNPSSMSVCTKCNTPLPSAAPTITVTPNAGTPHPADQTLTSSPGSTTTPDASTRAASFGPLHPGRVLGNRYEILQLLGEGGMGAVYKARDRELDRLVALKVIRPNLAQSPSVRHRFKQELILARQVTHRNVIRIFDLGEADGIKFISMEYIEGRDLKSLIREREKFTPVEAAQIMEQVCQALEAAHREGVIHRDLKPQNIMVDGQGKVSVMDFGIARSMEIDGGGMTLTGALVGTPEYMSPEQAKGEKVDAQTDLFSLGIIFYELLTGKSPYKADTAMSSLYKRATEPARPPIELISDIPRALNDIAVRCLEIDKSKRYSSASEILADLQGSRSTSASRSLQIPIPPFVERRWTWAAAALALFLILLLAIPAFRHRILGGKPAGSAARSGIPSLQEGKFVAVLPFRVLGDQQSLGYVAEGLNESLSAKLFQVKDVRLASEAAVSKASPNDPLEKTARSLGVNLIVQGTVQGSAEKLGIIVNLTGMADGKRLWSEAFSGNAQDLLTIEDNISAKLLSALSLKPTTDELARVEAHPTENIEAYDFYLRGRNAMRGQQELKNVETAVSFYEQALKKDPKFALAYAGLADASLVVYRLKKDRLWSDRAVAAAQQAQRLDDKLPEVHFALGGVYTATGRNAEAVAELKHAVELAPNSDEGYRGLGNAYMSLGQKEGALQAYQQAIATNPYYWLNYDALGVACWRLGENDRALGAFRRITELEPDNAYGYMHIGLVYFQQGKYDESLGPLQKALELQPFYASYSNLGTAYFYLKRYNESVQMFEKAVELSPDDEEALGNLADAYRWSGQKEKAQAGYDKAIALAYKELAVNPRRTTTLVDLALYYAKKGDTARGLDFIRRARAISRNNVETIYSEAVVDALAGRSDESLSALREAFQKGYSPRQAQSDPELASLQSRAEFQKLVSEFGRKSR